MLTHCSTITALPAATHRLADLETAFNTRRRTLIATVHSAELAGRVLAVSRSQRRDGRGRFLSQAWLAAAETFTPTDLAWFRSALTEGK